MIAVGDTGLHMTQNCPDRPEVRVVGVRIDGSADYRVPNYRGTTVSVHNSEYILHQTTKLYLDRIINVAMRSRPQLLPAVAGTVVQTDACIPLPINLPSVGNKMGFTSVTTEVCVN